MKYQYFMANATMISPLRIQQLLAYLGSEQELFELPDYKVIDILQKLQIKPNAIAKYLDFRNKWNLDDKWLEFLESGIGFTTISSSNYPKRLKTIADPPYALFYKGKLPSDKKYAIAIVGARGRTAYGETAALELAEYLGSYKVDIISGLALGIDSDAHKGALIGGSKTFAVLGCGVDVVYPKSNAYLYEQILEEDGGIISEFPPKTQAIASNFPRRNRIISGLSECVIVIEAREKSGSLITADFAMEQGRDVFALPGRLSDPLSMGCNRLIHQGCGMFLSPKELALDLELELKENYKIQKAESGIYNIEAKIMLEKDESLLYSLIDFAPVSLNQLMEKSNFSISILLETLEKLKQKCFIKEHPTNFYVRTKL